MKRTIVHVALVTLTVLSFGSGCASPAGKAVKYKAKKASPLHDTKLEKVEKKVDRAERTIEKSRD